MPLLVERVYLEISAFSRGRVKTIILTVQLFESANRVVAFQPIIERGLAVFSQLRVMDACVYHISDLISV